MTFLIWLTIILGVLVLGQIARVYELATELRGTREWEVRDKDNKMNARIMFLFIFAFFGFCFWQLLKYKDKLLPPAASELGREIDWLLNFNFVIIGVVFLATNFLLFYFASKYYHKGAGTKAYFYPVNHKLELIWTVVPGIALAVIIFLGIRLWTQITTQPEQKDAIVIQLYARQFDWTIRYAGKDNTLGKSDYKLINDERTNIVGLDSTDQHSWDDIVVFKEFHIPVGKQILFMCNSRDVIHSAALPHFRSQMNCVPGMTTRIHFKPTITTDSMRRITNNPNFDYILMCYKICGPSHYNMQAKIVVDKPADYQKWLDSKKPFFAKSEAPKMTASAETKKEDTEKKIN